MEMQIWMPLPTINDHLDTELLLYIDYHYYKVL